MRIVIAHTYYKQPGGEDQCVAAEAAMLEANGHDVARFSLSNNATDGMNRLALAARTIWSGSAAKDLHSLVSRHRAEIVHFHNTFPLMSPSVYYAARVAGAAVVQTLHNFRITCPNALLFRDGAPCEDCLGKAVAWRGIARKCYRDSRAATATVAAMASTHRLIGTWRNQVDAYIALSEFSRRKLIAGGLPADKIAVKPNFAYPDPGPGTGAGQFALFVGRLSREKGLGVALDAWRHVGERVPLRIVGDGPLAPDVAAAVSGGGSITWTRQVSLDEIYRLMGDAALLIVASECYENFPRVIIEAFAKGTPVIAPRLGGMAEIVRDGVTGVQFAPGDGADLARKVCSLAGDAPTLMRMRGAARAEFEQRYTAEVNHAALLDIYVAALAAARSGSTGGKRNASERVERY